MTSAQEPDTATQPTAAIDVAQRDGGSSDGQAPTLPADEVISPTRLMRLAAMSFALLEELRGTPLDDRARRRMRDIFDRSQAALREALPENLAGEVSDLMPAPPTGTPTQAELRVMQAQLNGWLAGLLQGLQAAVWSQHVATQRQLEDQRRAQVMEAERRERRPGTYL